MDPRHRPSATGVVIHKLFLLPSLVFLTFGCHRSQSKSLPEVYSEIRFEFQRGDLDSALKALAVVEGRSGSRDSEWFWRFRVLKAEVLLWRGQNHEVLSLLAESVPPRFTGTDFAVRRQTCRAIAQGYLHQFEQSRTSLADAEQMATKSQPQLLGEVFLAKGSVAVEGGAFSEAVSSFQMALTHARNNNQPFLEANATGSLGRAAMWQEHYDEGIDWFKKSLQLSQALNARASSAKTLGNIGWSYHEIGDLVNALSQFRGAERASQEASLLTDQAYWLNSAAGVEYDQHNYAAASSDAQRAIVLTEQLKDDGTKIECLQTIALVALQKGQYGEAAVHLAEAERLETRAPNHQRQLYTRLIAAQVAARTQDFSRAEHSYSELLRDPESRASLRWEAQAGLANIHAAQGKAVLAEGEFKEAISTISKVWREIEQEEFRLSFLSSAIRFYDAYVSFLVSQGRPLDALKVADLSRAQTLERGLSSGSKGMTAQPASFHPQEIARRLNATLLLYRLAEQRSYLWAITPTQVSLFPLPGSAEIGPTAKSYLESFTDPRDPLETGNADGKKLYAVLIQPAEKLIPKNSRVIILPDGSLNSLNFEALLVPGQKPHYWIEDVTVVTANSLSLLSRTPLSTPPKSPNLLFLGDALFASPDFPPLPQAGKEAGLVEKYFPAPRRTVLTGAKATPSRFLSERPEAFSYLHFATHGTASTTRPLESAVILSPEGDSYKLYARDIVRHPLHAYLVTISACNGAGMRTYAGEGLVGLAWAFLRAGAHNVIAGLWEVSNASTPQLMDELYKGLNAGKDPATALRDAKLTLVHSTGNYRKPFYWAPFQLYAGT